MGYVWNWGDKLGICATGQRRWAGMVAVGTNELAQQDLVMGWGREGRESFRMTRWLGCLPSQEGLCCHLSRF